MYLPPPTLSAMMIVDKTYNESEAQASLPVSEVYLEIALSKNLTSHMHISFELSYFR